jgi:hypothetical protein
MELIGGKRMLLTSKNIQNELCAKLLYCFIKLIGEEAQFITADSQKHRFACIYM